MTHYREIADAELALRNEQFIEPEVLETHPPHVNDTHLDDLADVLHEMMEYGLYVIFALAIAFLLFFVAPKAFASLAIDTNPHCANGRCVMPMEQVK